MSWTPVSVNRQRILAPGFSQRHLVTLSLIPPHLLQLPRTNALMENALEVNSTLVTNKKSAFPFHTRKSKTHTMNATSASVISNGRFASISTRAIQFATRSARKPSRGPVSAATISMIRASTMTYQSKRQPKFRRSNLRRNTVRLSVLEKMPSFCW